MWADTGYYRLDQLGGLVAGAIFCSIFDKVGHRFLAAYLPGGRMMLSYSNTVGPIFSCQIVVPIFCSISTRSSFSRRKRKSPQQGAQQTSEPSLHRDNLLSKYRYFGRGGRPLGGSSPHRSPHLNYLNSFIVSMPISLLQAALRISRNQYLWRSTGCPCFGQRIEWWI